MNSFGQPKPLKDPPSKLIQAVDSGDCILFAGGGLSAQAGLPSRRESLDLIIQLAQMDNNINDETALRLTRSLDEGEFEAVADELTVLLKAEELRSYFQRAVEGDDSRMKFLGKGIRSVFGKAKPSSAHRILADFPFFAALTMNYDSLLSEAFRDRDPLIAIPSDVDDLLSAVKERQFFILHLFGAFARPEPLWFTQRVFRSFLSENLQFRQLMTTLFRRYTHFFVGESLSDIRSFVETIDLPQEQDREHFALVGEPGGIDESVSGYLHRRFSIRTIEVRTDDDYLEMFEFLQTIRSGLSSVEHDSLPSERQTLDRVELRNIGPFEKLDIDLTSSWNVILGDNGMGKTVILRAIAAALCGESADSTSVKRLLRTGTDRGSIKLWVGASDYRVELARDQDGRVHIMSQALSPMKVDNWLVLGFPALRAMTWEKPKGPRDLIGENGDGEGNILSPSSEDLQPILIGAPDTRLNDLKQWIINLDYQSSDRLRDKFFDVLDTLTPKVKLKLHEIDKQTYEIKLDTDGGIVPMEAVSQGTASITCWVGILLQRLDEAYDNLEKLEQGEALVLIDEIDAHMHPRWQRSIAGQIRKEFKTVQFIATTHSPLIVGSLAREEVIWVHRSPLFAEFSGVVRIDFDKEMDNQYSKEKDTSKVTLISETGKVEAVAITPDGERAVSASDDNTLRVWDLETGQTLHALEGHSEEVADVAITPDGERAVSASDDNTLRVWDLETGQTLHTLEGHSGWVVAVAITPDGGRVVSASWDNTLRVWDLDSGQTLHTLEGHTEWLSAVTLAPNGERAVSASGDGTLRVWDLDSGQTLRTLEGHAEWVSAAALAPDGERAVSASGDGTLRVWDLQSGQTLHILEGHTYRVTDVAITPDGGRVVSASWDETLRVWDLETGQTLRTLEGHTDLVWNVVVTSDGERAVSASEDGTLRVWDLASGQTLHTLEGHAEGVYDVAVTSDGERAISTSHDTTLRVWDLLSGQTIHILEGHASTAQVELQFEIPITAELLVADGDPVNKGDQLTKDDVRIIAENPTFDFQGLLSDQILTAPFFNLESTRDPVTEERIEEYTDLIVMDEADLSPDDALKLEELARDLKVEPPSWEQKKEAQRALELIQSAMWEEAKTLSDEELDKISKAIKSQLIKSSTGSRRQQ